jgi:hypothetical protein
VDFAAVPEPEPEPEPAPLELGELSELLELEDEPASDDLPESDLASDFDSLLPESDLADVEADLALSRESLR